MVAEIAGTACRYRREAAWRPAPWAAFLITLAVPPLGFLYLQRLWMAGASLVLAVCALPFVLHEPALWAALAVLAALLAATLAMRAREPVARRFYATPLGLVLCLWVGVAVFAAGRAHVVGVYRVTSASMMPGIAVNDLLFVKRWEDAPLERGKVYLFRLGEEGGSFGVARGEIDLGAVDFGDGEGEVFVKRLVGLPGDRVTMWGNRLALNGRPVSTVAMPGTGGSVFAEALGTTRYPVLDPFGISFSMQDFILGEDEYFFLGDNRAISADSRLFGPVSRSRVIGEATTLFER